ncbi:MULTISPECIES: hybrid sensor histidine kinase/response regulator [unclassified Nostoc]|uniref:hybrid sensor histidine kinase/response regulator n=1 Tax=unclassified Nostoc TaxID=2593658 RepID=UPI002AD52109|nr:hybrid sensor histidine kinase/response regulator [Nostoc sp. DedQUE03]MDZ7976745.1 hybrid sensor histidine kinase/response regulator [Nostoc sp. DedQUE03]MDZ8043230.1 hybrid sensor histidine kinase/response regulator [Nostoc sp. DedQUE02]
MNTILIIEDEPQVRENIQEILQLSDFETLIAANGKIGLEIAKKQLPDLIICDITMPELDGYSVLSALRQNEATIHIPLIFVTAKAERSDFRQGMDFGADDYLTKPFTPEELLNAIACRLEKHALVERQTQAKLDELRMNIAHSLPHELNTPLNGILGMSQLLVENCGIMPGSEEVEIAELIYTSANRLNELVKRFLLYSNLELIAKNPEKIRQVREQKDKCLAERIISEVAFKKATENCRQKDLKLDIQESTVKISAENLSILIEELLENSFKFSLASSEVKVISKVKGSKFNLYVIDRGKGMTIEEIDKIGAFVQFNRKSWEQQGSGLGLAIVQHIVKLYGGELIIDSIPEKGTIVNVCLPC